MPLGTGASGPVIPNVTVLVLTTFDDNESILAMLRAAA
jgi:hypothetical protein